jgi:hypothetical protein
MKSLLVFIFLYSQAFGQNSDSLLKKYDQQFLYRYGKSFSKGGNKLSFGDLKNEFRTESPSFGLYVKSKQNRTVSTILRIVTLAAIVVVVNVAQNNTKLAWGIISGQFLVAIGSQYYYNKATEDLDRAIMMRNRELLIPSQ